MRSAIVGDVFLLNGEAHAVMLMGFERFEFHREGDTLILCGLHSIPPVILRDGGFAWSEDCNAE